VKDLHKVDWSKIPEPLDGGEAKHLLGMSVPSINLQATDGTKINLSSLTGRTVVYAYPMTGRPDVPLPEGWDMLPGARGCTPQSCAFRDHAAELTKLGVNHLFGLSTQETEYQKEAATRLHLPFSLLSDNSLILQKALNLPVMAVNEMTLLKRLTLVIENGQISHTHYPVFPPAANSIHPKMPKIFS